MLRASISRITGKLPVYSSSVVASASVKQSAHFHTSQGRLESYKYVNAEEEDLSWKGITDRAALTIFWTELFRGALTKNYLVQV